MTVDTASHRSRLSILCHGRLVLGAVDLVVSAAGVGIVWYPYAVASPDVAQITNVSAVASLLPAFLNTGRCVCVALCLALARRSPDTKLTSSPHTVR